jgi:hypothetical protein
MTPGNPTPNEEDDLFNFDDLFRSPSKSEPATVAAPAASATATRAPAAVPKPLVASAAPAPANTPGQLPLVRPVTPKPQSAPVPQTEARTAMLEREPRRASALTFATLGLATLVNLALVGVVWRSMSGMGNALREVGDQVARASELSAEPAREPGHEWQAIMDAAPKSGEGEQALEAAAHDLAIGDFERCRVRLYSLLTVVDRFDVKLRSGLTSRAQVMIADSYREQADRVERESATHVGESGFLSVPGESQR